jgi:hypothetical protein
MRIRGHRLPQPAGDGNCRIARRRSLSGLVERVVRRSFTADRNRRRALNQIGDQHDKFISAIARSTICRAQTLLKNSRKGLEDFISDHSPASVVDLLEIIKIRHGNAERDFLAFEYLQFPSHCDEHCPATQYGRQRIVGCHFLHLPQGDGQRLVFSNTCKRKVLMALAR